jgi:hypothetical protein
MYKQGIIMATNLLYYTVLNANGDIIFSQITQDPNYPIGEGQRLVKDQTPEYNTLTQYIIRITPVPPDQDYVEYQIKDIVYTDEELSEQATGERNLKLLNTDWTQLPDVALSAEQIQAWREYRQLLRDITDQSNYPREINWPIAPE